MEATHQEFGADKMVVQSSSKVDHLRKEMRHFIEQELDLSIIGHHRLFFDSESIKRVMHHVACDLITSGRAISELSFTEKLPTSLLHLLINQTKHILKQKHLRQMKSRVACMINPDSKMPCEDSLVLFEGLATNTANCDRCRAQFLERVELQAPDVLRVIDIEATCQEKQVVLLDHWADAGVQQVGYSAISHTYGMYVYEVFDCQCASKCSTKVRRPRCSDKPCVHATGANESSSNRHRGVVNDILRMCATLRAAGVKYAWHDGVCIAQHDNAEVDATIKCIGWIYSNAKETIIFLHYVGRPMAPIRYAAHFDDLTSRWQTRVWTLQEATLSKCRRYCVRMGTSPFSDCQTFEEFGEKVSLWCLGQWSKIEIIEEEAFFEILLEIFIILIETEPSFSLVSDSETVTFKAWHVCIYQLLQTLEKTCFGFPTINRAIEMCSERKCKHEGDRINSILALGGVKDFVAPKDDHVEASTLEFFKRQGQRGLACAVFSFNTHRNEDVINSEVIRQHTWLPLLGSRLKSSYLLGFEKLHMPECRVVEDGKLELRGSDLVCVRVRFTALVTGQTCYVSSILSTSSESINANVALLGSGNHDDLIMVINPAYEGSLQFRTTLLESPTCDLGIATILQYERCSDMGQAMRYGDKIEDKETIHAHLVLPYAMASFMINLEHPHSVSSTLPVLIVQGSCLDAPVSKIGQFMPTSYFLKLIFEILKSVHSCITPKDLITIRQGLVIS